jgi:uncharacterized membrane protein
LNGYYLALAKHFPDEISFEEYPASVTQRILASYLLPIQLLLCYVVYFFNFEPKMYFFILVFLLTGCLASAFLKQNGAFEVYYEGIFVWSSLATRQMPDLRLIFQRIGQL